MPRSTESQGVTRRDLLKGFTYGGLALASKNAVPLSVFGLIAEQNPLKFLELSPEEIKRNGPTITDTAVVTGKDGIILKQFALQQDNSLCVSQYNGLTKRYTPYEKLSTISLDSVDAFDVSKNGSVIVAGGAEITGSHSQDMNIMYSLDSGKTFKKVKLGESADQGSGFHGDAINQVITIPNTDKFIIGTKFFGNGGYGLNHLYIFVPTTEAVREIEGYDTNSGLSKITNVFTHAGKATIYAPDFNFKGIRKMEIDLLSNSVTRNEKILGSGTYFDVDVKGTSSFGANLFGLGEKLTFIPLNDGRPINYDYETGLLKAVRRKLGNSRVDLNLLRGIKYANGTFWISGDLSTNYAATKGFIAAMNSFDHTGLDIDLFFPSISNTDSSVKDLRFENLHGQKGVSAVVEDNNGLSYVTFIKTDSYGTPKSSPIYPDKGL